MAELVGVPARQVGGILRFRLDDLTGIATPIRSEAPLLVGRGLTSGGIPEFVVPNTTVQDLSFELEILRSAASVAR